MGTVYATVDDIRATGRTLTAAEEEAATTLLATASAKLRLAAVKHGKDLDEMIGRYGEDYLLAVKSVTVQAVVRALDSVSDTPSVAASEPQSAMGYSVSMSYINAGQSLYLMKNELKELMLLTPQIGAMEVYACATDQGDRGHTV